MRGAVASALRRIDTQETRETLLSLLADPEPFVQHLAIESLGRRQLSEVDLTRIQTLIENHKLSRGNYELLVNLCLTQPRSTQTESLLRSLAEQDDIDPETRARISRILDDT